MLGKTPGNAGLRKSILILLLLLQEGPTGESHRLGHSQGPSGEGNPCRNLSIPHEVRQEAADNNV